MQKELVVVRKLIKLNKNSTGKNCNRGCFTFGPYCIYTYVASSIKINKDYG